MNSIATGLSEIINTEVVEYLEWNVIVPVHEILILFWHSYV